MNLTKVPTTTQLQPVRPVGRPPKTGYPVKLTIPTEEYRSLPIPGVEGNAKLGECFVRVTDIPGALDNYMEVNPRVPNRTSSGILSGPVAKGILSTLRDNPEEMALKNQGIYLLVEEASFRKANGGIGAVEITLSNIGKHGIVNGGHTYAAIREAVDNAEAEELEDLKNAYVRLHIYQGVNEDYVAQIAEGLNRSKQVDDPSLINLQGHFDVIRKVLKGKPFENAVAYHQGDSGDIYISELLVYLSFFNTERFGDKKQPHQLYRKQAQALKYFEQDINDTASPMKSLINMLPDILKLSDLIRKLTPEAAKHNNFEFGRIKVGSERAGNPKHKGTTLPFIGESVDYRVPNGWVYPMLAAFRANISWNKELKSVVWKQPLDKILPEVIDDLVAVCVTEHRDNNMRPELIGNRESAYSQCYDKVQLYLAKKGLL